MTRLTVLVSLLPLWLAAGCGGEKPDDSGTHTTLGAAAPGTGVANPGMLARSSAWLPPGADEGNWLTTGRDYGMTRYSPLGEITPANVGQLKMAWTFETAVKHGHEAAPLVAGNTMYFVAPFPNRAYALDLTQPGAPLKWKYEPNPSPMAIGKACCDAVTRGAVIADGKLIYNLLDAHTVAVDTANGREVWRTKMANVADGTTMTMAPLAVGNRVYVGNSGGEMGVHGWLAALDVKTGKELWRAYSTGPDSMVRLDASYRPFYDWLKGKNLGVSTWSGDSWKHGAGAAWGWVSYDPDLDAIYYGTSNPGPWNADQRGGLNLFTSAVFARDAKTGMARWAFQFTPHNEWDYDGVNENILTDLPIGGRSRKVMVQFNRNGFGYTIDRATGEVLVAKPFGYLNWATGIDPKTAQPIVNPAKHTVPSGRWVRDICPPDIGDKDWEPAAFSPRTNLFYVPVQNACMDYKGRPVSYIAGTPYWGADMKRHPGPGGGYGEFIAWDAATGRKVWGIKEHFYPSGGPVVTASDLVFYGTTDGWIRAADARSGRVLWSQKLGSGVLAAPMTYRGPDGHQYLAVVTGVGGFAMTLQAEKNFPPRGGTLYVFTLPGNVAAVPEQPGAQQGSGSGASRSRGGGHR
jgi:lanthanide-dependent methanol dehydrogenase